MTQISLGVWYIGDIEVPSGDVRVLLKAFLPFRAASDVASAFVRSASESLSATR